MKIKFLIFLLMGFYFNPSYSQKIVWKSVASLPVGSGGEAIVLNNKIYFISANSTTTGFYRYDPSINTWENLTNLPEWRANLALAEIDGKIYAIGGDEFGNTNYEYTPETDTWKALAPMPTKRQHIDCGIVDNKIYVIGGLTSWTTITKKNEVYDTKTDTWSEKASIPSLRNNPAIVTMDSLIYVIGGAGSTTDVWKYISTIECYNIKTDQWMSKSNIPFALFKPGALVVNKKIFVLGGQKTNGASSSVLWYDEEKNKWNTTTSLPKINAFAGYASIGDKLYVIGGTSCTPENWTWYTDVYEGTVIDTISSSVANIQNEKNLCIFPNPTSGLFSISFGTTPPQQAIVSIFNMEGKLVLTRFFQNIPSATLNLSGYSKGIYLTKLWIDGILSNQKICIE
jgi:N-acetylneuraminic acid mutarotase